MNALSQPAFHRLITDYSRCKRGIPLPPDGRTFLLPRERTRVDYQFEGGKCAHCAVHSCKGYVVYVDESSTLFCDRCKWSLVIPSFVKTFNDLAWHLGVSPYQCLACEKLLQLDIDFVDLHSVLEPHVIPMESHRKSA